MTGVSISDRWLRLIVIGMVVFGLIAGGMYVALRLRATYTNQADVARLQAEVEAFHKLGGDRLRMIEERLESLEQTVYGQLEPAVSQPHPEPRPRVIREPPWSLNRDRELRERIRRLEMWRMQQEQFKEQASK